MKKREIIISLITLMVGIMLLGIGWHRAKKASIEGPNLIKCVEHVDENLDMSCDKCGATLSFGDIVKYQEIKNTTEEGVVVEAKGNMPENTTIVAKEIKQENATKLVQKYIPEITKENVLYAYDISMKTNNGKYQPKNFEQSVEINIDNIKLDQEKVALMHIISATEYEIIKLDDRTLNGIKFKATSFSSYILLNVANQSESLQTPGSYSVYGTNGTVDPKSMVTEWTIPEDNIEIKLPVQSYFLSRLNITVDWGDGSATERVITKFPTHTYASAGTYDITISGTCPVWGYAKSDSASIYDDYKTYTTYLTKVKQFGELSTKQYGFAQCYFLTEVSGENLVTAKTFEKTTDMSLMFFSCVGLKSLDVSKFDTSNVTSMQSMFNGCSNVEYLDVSNFNTSKVTDIWGMFHGCSKLTNLDVSKFDTSKVTDMGSMFDGCSSLTSLDVSNFNTSNVEKMAIMFSGCKSLTNLDVSNFDTSKVTSLKTMFHNCSSLTSLDVSNFDTSNVKNMSYMFENCSNLKRIRRK